MPEKSNEGSEFRVVDKRRFDETGESRPNIAENPEAAERAALHSPSPERKSESPTRQDRRSEQGQGSVDFSSLIMSLATQALVMMGEIPSEQMQGTRNLEGAQQTIDIIGMLLEKTRGNLSAEEDRLVTEVLAQLRMAFVNSVGK